MACMCGDICCPSCGPAQGNWRCPLCRAWASDGCEHFEVYCEDCGAVLVDDDEVGGECNANSTHRHRETVRVKPEYQAALDAHERAERKAEEQLVKDLEEADRLAEEYWRDPRNKYTDDH